MTEFALTDVQYFLDEFYNLKPTYMTGYFGNTAQFMSRTEQWKGYSMHEKAILTLHSGARATTDLEAAMPTSVTTTALDIEIAKTNLREIQASCTITDPADTITTDPAHSALQIAEDIVMQMEASIAQKRDQLLHGNSRATKAVVAAKYALAGTVYGANRTAFIQIKDGSIANFQEGSLITVRNGSSVGPLSTDRGIVQVKDVCRDVYYKGLAIGPGLVIYGYDNDQSTLETNLDDVAVDDELCDSSEGSVGHACGFDTLFPTSFGSTLPWFSVTDRGAAGFQALIPYRKDAASGGAAVDLDVETHFGWWANLVPYVIPNSRAYRKTKGVKVTDALVWIAEPKLVHELNRQIGSTSSMFTREFSTSMDAAKRTQLVGNAGFTGSVIHYQDLPPIVVRAEPLCKPNRIISFDPSSWKWLRLGAEGSGMKPRYARAPGSNSVFHRLQQTDVAATLPSITKRLACFAYVDEMPYCDCPQSNFAIDGVKSTI